MSNFRSFRSALEFLVWAQKQREVTPEAIQSRFGCHRATAYRRWRDWGDAKRLTQAARRKSDSAHVGEANIWVVQ